jgi:hypothetical protein
MTNTNLASSSAPPIWQRRVGLPAWVAAAAFCGAVILGAVIGAAGTGDGNDEDVAGLQQGTISSVDTDGRSVCLEHGGEVECYDVAGTGVAPGERVQFVVEQVPVDPTDTSKGTHGVIVHLEPVPVE